MLRHLARKARRCAIGLAAGTEPVILMYHRVAAPVFDPWHLAVDPENFAAQMGLLKRKRRPVTLDRMVQALGDGTLERDMVAITFDDAYRDVLENAKPVLDALEIPATVFVVTEKLGDARGFWWDRLAVAVLGGTMPETLATLPFLDEHRHGDIDRAFKSGSRTHLHLALWNHIRLLDADAREAAVDEVEWLFAPTPLDPAPIMTEAELGTLTSSGWISLGAHTATHPSLPALPAAAQREEMGRSKAWLETMTGAPMRRLAYPFGDYCEQSMAIARDLGFDYAVSVEAGRVRSASARFRLPRHDIKNWTGEEFSRRLRWRL